jgi:hypothetical protein
MIFQRKNKGRKANPRPTTFLTRFAEELRRAIAGEINFRRKVESRKANPGPSMLRTSPTQKELRRAGAFPIIFQRKNKGRKANPRGAGSGLLTQRSLRPRKRGFWMLDVFSRLRDALTRGFLIGEEIAHAKPRQEYGVEPQRSRRGNWVYGYCESRDGL